MPPAAVTTAAAFAAVSAPIGPPKQHTADKVGSGTDFIAGDREVNCRDAGDMMWRIQYVENFGKSRTVFGNTNRIVLKTRHIAGGRLREEEFRRKGGCCVCHDPAALL